MRLKVKREKTSKAAGRQRWMKENNKRLDEYGI